MIVEAGLRALWRGPHSKFPENGVRAYWEIWLAPELVETFISRATQDGVVIGADRLLFPEDTVVIGEASREQLALAVRRTGAVRALAAPSVTAAYFDELEAVDQADWVTDLARRTNWPGEADTGFLTLMDTGVSRAHPLVQPLLAPGDRHAANPAWALEDIKGHGTALAGLAVFGDLTSRLQDTLPISINYRLESVKIFPDADFNPHYLLGAVTRDGVNAVEVTARRRTFAFATTTSDDMPHDGAPTSWSTEIDQLAAGVSGLQGNKRLILNSAGNNDASRFGTKHYLDVCDHADSELESPAQAWNAICVGAFTEKTFMPAGEKDTPLAPFGDLSPVSRTASWSSQWPLKPDIVMEGGNWTSGKPPMSHSALSLLTTSHRYPLRSFSLFGDTSAAAALAARQITQLWSDYPELWPETIRALYVSSARWTNQMKSHLPTSPLKGAYASLFRRYGFGVPDLARARRSASNALTLIVQDEITPYGLSEATGSDVHKEMLLFELPWPVEELRKLASARVTLRVALSSFVAPNPSEAARGSRYRYASHNLRFKLNRAGEKADQFLARISKLADPVEGLTSEEDDSWNYGSVRRDVGSLHIDELTCAASDLARRNLIAIHPVAGWWKNKTLLKSTLPKARFALVVEIDAEQTEADLYAEVRASVAAMGQVQTVVTI
ncbi:hypothetical protein FHS97_003284 [Sphingomonas endophytica]|uniref:Peptidase S8/S53 domain-containing protein n=2 Tax=Sphingomonas endophytica TaxID=869719 RepID=A0ABR6N9U3_9SPHN|nr:hypothetical protein [Sphingomonas endophytica]